jgi:hypothetical protein
MAAATSTATSANKASLWRKLQRVTAARATKNLRPTGLYLIEASAAVATTNVDDANDELRIVEFPDGQVYLLDLKVELTDCDTNGAPALVVDFITDDGSTEAVLINDSTIGQAGGTDDLDANVDMDNLEVGGKFLAMKVVTAAATAAAGTVTVRALVYIDPVTSW